MDLSPEDIEELGKIYKDEFKEELSPDEARAMANRLIEFFLVISQP